MLGFLSPCAILLNKVEGDIEAKRTGEYDCNAYQVGAAVEPEINLKLDTYVFLWDELGFFLAESIEHF